MSGAGGPGPLRWVDAHIRAILLVAGALTSTMFYAVLAPDAALQSSFGETLTGDAARLVVRSWGFLVGGVGLMLIHAARVPASRPLVLWVAVSSKLAFIGLILAGGGRWLGHGAGVALLLDAVWVLLLSMHLASLALAARALRPA
jgi:hypothetical protein